MNLTVFNLILGVNETRFLVQHELCEFKCRLNENTCNSKRKWNRDKCQCECQELDHRSPFKYDYMWNPSTCACDSECDKTGKIV